MAYVASCLPICLLSTCPSTPSSPIHLSAPYSALPYCRLAGWTPSQPWGWGALFLLNLSLPYNMGMLIHIHNRSGGACYDSPFVKHPSSAGSVSLCGGVTFLQSIPSKIRCPGSAPITSLRKDRGGCHNSSPDSRCLGALEVRRSVNLTVRFGAAVYSGGVCEQGSHQERAAGREGSQKQVLPSLSSPTTCLFRLLNL